MIACYNTANLIHDSQLSHLLQRMASGGKDFKRRELSRPPARWPRCTGRCPARRSGTFSSASADLVALTSRDQEMPDRLAADRATQFVVIGDHPTIDDNSQHATAGGANVAVGEPASAPVTVSGAHDTAIGSQTASGANFSVVGSQAVKATATPSPDGTPPASALRSSSRKRAGGRGCASEAWSSPSPPSSAASSPSPCSPGSAGRRWG
jgi:hypothetical protein